MNAEDGPLEAGRQVGAYRIVEPIGSGGLGYVYRAVSDADDEVALKMIKPEWADDTTVVQRFEREARLAREISHPHLVPVVASGEVDGIPYLVQKFISGGSLSQRIEQLGRLDPVSTVVICQQVAAGLDALHQAGIIHRDIKPDNILLEGDTAFISDLGLVKELQGARLTAKGQALGTIDYISPEQIRGDEVTGAADVYALGCVAFACLVGRPPFSDRSGMKVLWAHLQDAPENPAAAASDIPAGIGDAVLIALAKEPGRRPRTAGMFGQLLKMGLLG